MLGSSSKLIPKPVSSLDLYGVGSGAQDETIVSKRKKPIYFFIEVVSRRFEEIANPLSAPLVATLVLAALRKMYEDEA
jgi:hypothetical protein